MATNRKKMNDIAKEPQKNKAPEQMPEQPAAERDLAEVTATELMWAVLDFFEDLTVKRFLEAANDCTSIEIQRVLREIDEAVTYSANGKPAVEVLQIFFDAEGMPLAAEPLDLLDILEDEDPEIYRDFMTDFLHYEEIEWLLRSSPMCEGMRYCPFFS